MLNNMLKSTLLCPNQIIDCRHLKLSVDFYELSQECVISFVEEAISWMLATYADSFVVAWKINNHSTAAKNLIKQALSSFQSAGFINVQHEAFVRSTEVNNVAALKKYRSQQNRRIYPSNTPSIRVSVDFEDYWKQLFATNPASNQDIAQRTLHLFREKNKINKARYSLADAQGSITFLPYSTNPSLFHGSFQLGICAQCLGCSIDNIANAMAEKMKSFSQTYCHLNGKVMLQPVTTAKGGSPYMDYFGAYRNSDGSHIDVGYTPNEWYYSYYLCGVEWANVISPLARKHIPQLISEAAITKTVAVEEVNSGAILLKSQNEITQFDIDDSTVLKQLVQDALYPGGSEFSVKKMLDLNSIKQNCAALPRHNWAIVPVLEEEIEIVGSKIILRSSNYW